MFSFIDILLYNKFVVKNFDTWRNGMKRNVKCVVSTVLTASMVMSVASCSLFDKAGKLCTEVGDEFMKAALERDLEDMVDLCSDEDDATEALEVYTFDNDPVQALLDRASFEAGKPECKTKDKKGKIVYTVTLPDYDAALDEDPEDVDEFEDILDDIKDTVEIEVTLEFKLDKKDNWVIDNPEDVAEDLFAELFDVNYGFESYLTAHIDHGYFYGASNDVYTNVGTLDYDLYFDTYDDFDYSFDVVYNGSVIFTESGSDYGSVWCYCSYYETSIYDSGNSYFPAGNYTYNIYDGDGALIVSATVTVENTYD